MKLLAVSGGPDSMILLHKNRNKKIVVAHINYNARIDSKNDENIVREYCKRFGVEIRVLNLEEKPKTNFQAWAREVRYNFFKEIYDEFKCDALLIAHHKNDFLETALMQHESGREPKYFGIKKISYFKDMKIIRPFIDKYWKKDILNLCKIWDVPYAIDSSNSKPIYTRNKKRIQISKLTEKEIKQRMQWFKMSNKILVKKQRKVDFNYTLWKNMNFSTKIFPAIHFKAEVIFEFLHEYGKNIKVTSDKIDSIIIFLMADNEAKEYKISNTQYILKEKKSTSIITKNST